jgi:hypothetical protein
MAIPDDVYSVNNAEKTCNPENSNCNADTKNDSTDKDQGELATQICQCFEEFPDKLSTLKTTKLKRKTMKNKLNGKSFSQKELAQVLLQPLQVCCYLKIRAFILQECKY